VTVSVSTLGPAKLHRATGGTTECVLAKHPTENRLQPLIRWRERNGEHIVELSTADVVALMASLVKMFSATQPEIGQWWTTLTAGKDNRGK